MSENRYLSEVTLWSNGMLTVWDDHGQQVGELQDRFCNAWPKVFERAKTEGKVCSFCIGDWWGGKVPCNPEALDRFYQDQLALIQPKKENENAAV